MKNQDNRLSLRPNPLSNLKNHRLNLFDSLLNLKPNHKLPILKQHNPKRDHRLLPLLLNDKLLGPDLKNLLVYLLNQSLILKNPLRRSLNNLKEDLSLRLLDQVLSPKNRSLYQ